MSQDPAADFQSAFLARGTTFENAIEELSYD
jgi:hypothetical protein